jgi:hypothetical protein
MARWEGDPRGRLERAALALPSLLAAFRSAPEVFRPRDFLRARAAVIAANPPLQERELIKMVSLSAALTAAAAPSRPPGWPPTSAWP